MTSVYLLCNPPCFPSLCCPSLLRSYLSQSPLCLTTQLNNKAACLISSLNWRFRLFSLDGDCRNNFLILLFLKSHFPNFSCYRPCFSTLILHPFSPLSPINHPFLFHSGFPCTGSTFPGKEQFHLWPWLINRFILALCSGHCTCSTEYQTSALESWQERIPPLQSKAPHPHLLLPCPGPQQLGPELEPVILVVFPGPGQLLPLLCHLVLSPSLAGDSLLDFLLKGRAAAVRPPDCQQTPLQAKLC